MRPSAEGQAPAARPPAEAEILPPSPDDPGVEAEEDEANGKSLPAFLRSD
jgi:hypothetical protein